MYVEFIVHLLISDNDNVMEPMPHGGTTCVTTGVKDAWARLIPPVPTAMATSVCHWGRRSCSTSYEASVPTAQHSPAHDSTARGSRSRSVARVRSKQASHRISPSRARWHAPGSRKHAHGGALQPHTRLSSAPNQPRPATPQTETQRACANVKHRRHDTQLGLSLAPPP